MGVEKGHFQSKPFVGTYDTNKKLNDKWHYKIAAVAKNKSWKFVIG